MRGGIGVLVFALVLLLEFSSNFGSSQLCQRLFSSSALIFDEQVRTTSTHTTTAATSTATVTAIATTFKIIHSNISSNSQDAPSRNSSAPQRKPAIRDGVSLNRLQLQRQQRDQRIRLTASHQQQSKMTDKTRAATTNNNRPPSETQTSRRIIMLMHVGKTGGSTLRNHVLLEGCRSLGGPRHRTACMQKILKTGESALSKYVKGITHANSVLRTKIQGSTDLLFTIREPIDRFESWYRYTNPQNCVRGVTAGESCSLAKQILKKPDMLQAKYFLYCFPTLEAVSQALLLGQDGVHLNTTTATTNSTASMADNMALTNDLTKATEMNSTECIDILRTGFQVVGLEASQQYHHLALNYRYYNQLANMNKHNKMVWAIRSEHLWSDISRLDVTFGGTGNFSDSEGKKFSHGSEAYSHEGRLSAASLPRMCCVLLPDILAYRQVVDRAANLNATEKVETYQLTWNKCNVTSWEMLEDRCKTDCALI